jgi:hypothetical protein
MTTTANDVNKYFTTEKATVAQPTGLQPTTPVVTGTVGGAGVVEYSRATPAVVKETYVVTKK